MPALLSSLASDRSISEYSEPTTPLRAINKTSQPASIPASRTMARSLRLTRLHSTALPIRRLLAENPKRLIGSRSSSSRSRGLAASTSNRSAQLRPPRRIARKSDARFRLWSRRKDWIVWRKRQRRPLDGEPFAALEHAAPKHVPSPRGTHPRAEPVHSHPAPILRLIGSLWHICRTWTLSELYSRVRWKVNLTALPSTPVYRPTRAAGRSPTSRLVV